MAKLINGIRKKLVAEKPFAKRTSNYIIYVINNQDYKNRVAIAYMMTNLLSRQYIAFRKNVALLIKRIEDKN